MYLPHILKFMVQCLKIYGVEIALWKKYHHCEPTINIGTKKFMIVKT